MPIQIHIEGKNAAEVATLVLDLANLINNNGPASIPAETKVSTVEDKPKKAAATTKKAVAPVVEEEETTGPDGEEEEIPDDVEIRAAAKEAGSKAGGRDKVKALLKKYDVPNVTAVPDKDRVKFLKDLQAI
jgi:hypothetical protein